MPKKKGPTSLFVVMSGVSTPVGYVNRVDVGAAHSLEEFKKSVEESIGLSIAVIYTWTPGKKENVAALIRLLRRDPGSAKALSSMIMAFMNAYDPSSRL